MRQVIAVDGPPLSHSYTATVIVKEYGPVPTRFGEFERGRFVHLPEHEVEQLLAGHRAFAIEPPIECVDPVYGAVATAKLLASADVSTEGWSRMVVPEQLLAGAGMNAVKPADRDWRVRIGTGTEILSWCSAWCVTLLRKTHDAIRAFLKENDPRAVAAAVELAELANSAGWSEERAVRDANIALALALSYHNPQQSARVHKFMTYRFPDWTWDQFRIEMSRLEDTLQPMRSESQPRRKCPATVGARVPLAGRGPSPRIAFLATKGAGR